MSKVHNFKNLIPSASKWILEQEHYILENGQALSEDQKIDGHLVGVTDPSKLRVMEFVNMPYPEELELQWAAEAIGLVTSQSRGTSYRYGIAVRRGWVDSRSLLIHEMTHTAQYERLGGIENFLSRYIHECDTVGYLNSPLEKEARRMEKKLCG